MNAGALAAWIIFFYECLTFGAIVAFGGHL